MERDWDNLIILDACRYDEYCKQHPFDAPVKRRVTLGSNTTEFLQRNFSGKQYHDTVYVTANPKGLKVDIPDHYDDDGRTFHATVSLLDEWDADTYTVLPQSVRKRTLEAQRKFPNKRLIVHFVQPHLPYIGAKASTLRSEFGISIGGWETAHLEYTETGVSVDATKVSFDAIHDDQYALDREDFLEAYRETLSITLPEVEELVGHLEGKTAITADHGEMFGERPALLFSGVYGHPKRLRTEELCVVPWVEINSESRKKVVSESPVEKEDYDEDTIERRLTALGYTEG